MCSTLRVTAVIIHERGYIVPVLLLLLLLVFFFFFFFFVVVVVVVVDVDSAALERSSGTGLAVLGSVCLTD